MDLDQVTATTITGEMIADGDLVGVAGDQLDQHLAVPRAVSSAARAAVQRCAPARGGPPRRPRARAMLASMVSSVNGFSRKSTAPARIAATASIRMAGVRRSRKQRGMRAGATPAAPRPAHPRHADIDQRAALRLARQLVEKCLAAGEAQRAVALAQRGHERFAHRVVVVDKPSSSRVDIVAAGVENDPRRNDARGARASANSSR